MATAHFSGGFAAFCYYQLNSESAALVDRETSPLLYSAVANMKRSMRSITWLSMLALLLLLLLGLVQGFTCPNFCSTRGMCLSQGVCSCPNSWTGADCSIARCPLGRAWADLVVGTDDGHNLVECSNRGVCNTDLGVCTCDAGFTGSACERSECSSVCLIMVVHTHGLLMR